MQTVGNVQHAPKRVNRWPNGSEMPKCLKAKVWFNFHKEAAHRSIRIEETETQFINNISII